MPAATEPRSIFLAAALVSLGLGPLAGCREAPPAPETAAGEAAPDGRLPAPPPPTDGLPWPRMRTVLVADLTPAEKRPLDLSVELDGLFRRALSAPGLFTTAATDDPGACAAEVDVVYLVVVNGEAVREATAGEARVGLDARVHCPARGTTGAANVETFTLAFEETSLFGGAHGGDGPSALRALLGRLAPRAAETLYGQVVVRHAPDEELSRLLGTSKLEGVLMEAASEAGERKLRSAVPHLVRLTSEEGSVVALRAGAALGLIGAADRDVLSALAKMTEGTDVERHLVAIHALADLGGPEAARYLDTIALGHPAPLIRQAARDGAARARGESPPAPLEIPSGAVEAPEGDSPAEERVPQEVR